MSNVNPHQNLFNILTVLIKLVPGSADLKKCIKEDMFAHPNRTAFDQVLHYLCQTYSPEGYKPGVPWPILDRSYERVFRNYTVAFVKDVCQKVPEANIPPFAPSFNSTPGGDRFARFMWKFSMLVLKTALERETGTPVLHYPTRGLHLVQALTEENLQAIRAQIDDTFSVIIDACNYSQQLCNEILKTASEHKKLRAELSDLAKSIEGPLSEKDRSDLLSDDPEVFMSVIAKWQAHINSEVDETNCVLQDLQDKSKGVRLCSESAQKFLNSKKMPVVLDATQLHYKSEEHGSTINLIDLFQKTAEASSMIFHSLSGKQGFSCFEEVWPILENISLRFQNVQDSFSETKCKALELAASQSKGSNCSPPAENLVSPLSLARTKVSEEMLQKVQECTPPMVFDVDRNVRSRFSSESPPIGGIPERINVLSKLKSVKKLNSSSVIASFESASNIAPPPSNATSNFFTTPSLPKRTMKFSSVARKHHFNASLKNAVETPLTFDPNPAATSTAYKRITHHSGSLKLPVVNVGEGDLSPSGKISLMCPCDDLPPSRKTSCSQVLEFTEENDIQEREKSMSELDIQEQEQSRAEFNIQELEKSTGELNFQEQPCGSGLKPMADVVLKPVEKKRRSFHSIVADFRKIVESSKQNTTVLSPNSPLASPGLNVLEEDFKISLDFEIPDELG